MRFSTVLPLIALSPLALVLASGCGGERDAAPAPSALPLHLAAAERGGSPVRPTSAAVEYRGSWSRLAVTDLASGRRRVLVRSKVWRGGDVGLAAPAFSPDGRRVAVARSTQDADSVRHTVILVARADGRGPARQVPGLRMTDVDAYRPVWTPDGRALAVPDGSGGTVLVDVATGARRRLLPHGGHDLAFAPDGRTYTFTERDEVWLGDAATGATRTLFDHARGARFSPDGRRIAYLSTRDRNGTVAVHEAPEQPAAELYVARADGTHPRRLTRTTADEDGPLRWTTDGKAVVFNRFGGGRLSARSLTVASGCERALDDLPGAGDLADVDLRVPYRWGTSSSSTSSRGTSPHSCSSR